MAGPSILIVDDEAFMRRIIRQTLSGLGFGDVTDVDSAAAALTLFSKSRFDLIISDIYMPNMSGLELLKQVRCGKTAAPRESRFIILTSLSNTEVLSTSIALDVNGFMVKPIKSDLVKKKMQKALSETMYLRPAEKYEMIPVEKEWASHQESKVIAVGAGLPQAEKPLPVVAEPEVQVTGEEGVELVSILQLEPGAVLAEQLIAKDGTLLLNAGQQLSQQMINRLHDLHPILRSDMLKIRCREDSSEESC